MQVHFEGSIHPAGTWYPVGSPAVVADTRVQVFTFPFHMHMLLAYMPTVHILQKTSARFSVKSTYDT